MARRRRPPIGFLAPVTHTNAPRTSLRPLDPTVLTGRPLIAAATAGQRSSLIGRTIKITDDTVGASVGRGHITVGEIFPTQNAAASDGAADILVSFPVARLDIRLESGVVVSVHPDGLVVSHRDGEDAGQILPRIATDAFPRTKIEVGGTLNLPGIPAEVIKQARVVSPRLSPEMVQRYTAHTSNAPTPVANNETAEPMVAASLTRDLERDDTGTLVLLGRQRLGQLHDRLGAQVRIPDVGLSGIEIDGSPLLTGPKEVRALLLETKGGLIAISDFDSLDGTTGQDALLNVDGSDANAERYTYVDHQDLLAHGVRIGEPLAAFDLDATGKPKALDPSQLDDLTVVRVLQVFAETTVAEVQRWGARRSAAAEKLYSRFIEGLNRISGQTIAANELTANELGATEVGATEVGATEVAEPEAFNAEVVDPAYAPADKVALGPLGDAAVLRPKPSDPKAVFDIERLDPRYHRGVFNYNEQEPVVPTPPRPDFTEPASADSTPADGAAARGQSRWQRALSTAAERLVETTTELADRMPSRNRRHFLGLERIAARAMPTIVAAAEMAQRAVDSEALATALSATERMGARAADAAADLLDPPVTRAIRSAFPPRHASTSPPEHRAITADRTVPQDGTSLPTPEQMYGIKDGRWAHDGNGHLGVQLDTDGSYLRVSDLNSSSVDASGLRTAYIVTRNSWYRLENGLLEDLSEVRRNRRSAASRLSILDREAVFRVGERFSAGNIQSDTEIVSVFAVEGQAREWAKVQGFTTETQLVAKGFETAYAQSISTAPPVITI